MIHGRGKNRNLIITGPVNCEKTFLLKPLNLIFSDSIFENPANDKYTCIGSGKVKVFLLNDFNWSKDLFPWYDMLLLLEGETVKYLLQRTFTVKILRSQLIWLYLQQARVQSSTEAFTMQVITARQR